MKATIIYDNTASEGFQSGWGFSCPVDQRILFDTEDPLYCQGLRIRFPGNDPHDNRIMEALVKGLGVVEYTNGVTTQRIRSIREWIKARSFKNMKKNF